MSKNVTIIQCQVLTHTLVLIRCQILILILILILAQCLKTYSSLLLCHNIFYNNVLTFIQMRPVSKITTKFLTR